MTNLESLQYPIGRFEPPTHIDSITRTQYIQTLRLFPGQVRSLTTGLSSAQLQVPYRPGGWTVRQVVNHCADSHAQALSRFKLALTEANPTVKPYQEQAWAVLADSQNDNITPALEMLSGIHQRWVILLEAMNQEDFQKNYFHPENQRQYTLDEILALYDWHSRHHLAHIRLALGQPELRLELAFDYHLKTFQSRSNTDNGEVSSQTIFHYRQQGSIVTAQYAGGGILEGQLIGTVDEAGVIQMHYQHLNTQKQLRTGRCQSTPERLPNGKIRLYENWQWTNGDQSSGHSVIEEV